MKVRYGKHTYASKNQKEYDAVMKIIDTAYPKYVKESFGGEYEQYFREYLGGARWNGDRYNLSEDERQAGLYLAEQSVGALVKYKVLDTEIEKLFKLSQASMLLAGSDSNLRGELR